MQSSEDKIAFIQKPTTQLRKEYAVVNLAPSLLYHYSSTHTYVYYICLNGKQTAARSTVYVCIVP